MRKSFMNDPAGGRASAGHTASNTSDPGKPAHSAGKMPGCRTAVVFFGNNILSVKSGARLCR